MRPSPTQTFRSFSEAKKFVRKLGLCTAQEYQDWASGKRSDLPQRPPDIPSNPHQVYFESWKGMGEWLGTKRVANYNRKFLQYNEARAVVMQLGFLSGVEFRTWAASGERPNNIPSNPWSVYRGAGWCGVRHWLGTGEPTVARASEMMQYEPARDFVRKLGLTGLKQWRAYVDGKMPHLPPKPFDIPAQPFITYKTVGWVNFREWLGNNHRANHRKPMRPYGEAEEFARSLGFDTIRQWRDWARTEARPTDIPANPDKHYRKEWRNWKRWLG